MAPVTSPGELADNIILAVAACILILPAWLFMLKRGSPASSDKESGVFQPTDLTLNELSRDISTKWTDLALHLGCNYSDVKTLESDHRGDVLRQCSEMLVAWCKKQSDKERAIRKLKRALVKVGLQEVVQRMGNTGEQRGSGKRRKTGPRDAAQHAADKCEEALKKIYTTTGSYVQIIPWIDDNQKHIMDIYSKLGLKNDHECDLKGEVKSYSDVFKLRSREGHPINRAIFKGTPGIGKTTLFDKIAYDWATGATAVLKRFKFVFVLKMRNLNQKSDLIDAVFDQLLDSAEISKADLTTFIAARAGEVLFLLDGFDEFMTDNLDEKNFGLILKTLNRKGEYKDCCAFVSTRSSHYDKLVKKCLIQRPFAHVNVLGFSYKDIKTYAEKFYSDDHSKANGLLERIGSSRVLLDLAKSPMLLLLMCLLWKVNSNLPETMSRLYNEAVKYIFKRKTNMSPAQISNLVIGIGRIAFDGLLSSNQKLSFEEGEFDQDIRDMALEAGILTSERVVRGLDDCKNVYFIHKTFQEFCAGKYYQSPNAEDTKEILETFFRNVDDPMQFEYLLRFCCGDNQGPKTQSILHMLSNDVHRRTMLVLVLDCFFESQCDTLPTDQVIEIVFSHPIVVIGVPRDISASLIYFLDCITDQTKGGRNTYLDRVHKLDISCCHSRQLGERLSHYVKNMRFLSEFTVRRSSFNKTQIKTCFDNKTHLQKLAIRPSLKPNPLTNQVELTVSDILHIVNTLNNMPKLVEVDLSLNVSLGGSYSTWSQLAKIKQIQTVKLVRCHLTEGDIPHIADALRNMPNLVKLDLSGNETLAGSGSAWSHLEKIEQIQKVNLKYNNFTAGDIPHIADALSKMPNLVKLNLSGNETLGGSGRAWSHLAQIKQIQKVKLAKCKLTGVDIPHIAYALSEIPNLVEMDLSFNETLSGSDCAWSHLAKIKLIQKVELGRCKLTVIDIAHIIVTLENMPQLVELDLWEN